jgi:predicted RNase H-like HicB family nuclease
MKTPAVAVKAKPASRPRTGAAQVQLSATVQKDGAWLVAFCPEIPEGNGQGKTKTAALKSLWESIELLMEDRRADAPVAC